MRHIGLLPIFVLPRPRSETGEFREVMECHGRYGLGRVLILDFLDEAVKARLQGRKRCDVDVDLVLAEELVDGSEDDVDVAEVADGEEEDRRAFWHVVRICAGGWALGILGELRFPLVGE